jgi:hypothetical protein
MANESEPFRYKSLPEIPTEYRRVDWTYIRVREKPFSEGEEAFCELKQELREVFRDNPYAYLHFLRAVEDCLVLLAIDTKQPTAKCLEFLRRRLNLEYDRGDIYGKAALVVLFAKYVSDSGQAELARELLTAERSDLEEIAGVCESWLNTINQRIAELMGNSGTGHPGPRGVDNRTSGEDNAR